MFVLMIVSSWNDPHLFWYRSWFSIGIDHVLCFEGSQLVWVLILVFGWIKPRFRFRTGHSFVLALIPVLTWYQSRCYFGINPVIILVSVTLVSGLLKVIPGMCCINPGFVLKLSCFYVGIHPGILIWQRSWFPFGIDPVCCVRGTPTLTLAVVSVVLWKQ